MKKNSPKKNTTKSKGKPKNNQVISSEEIDTKVPVPEPEPSSIGSPKKMQPSAGLISEENQKKLDAILTNAEKTSKYDFNLHKHLKENLKFRDKQCKDGLTKQTLYCLECKLSTCPNCALFKVHNGHPLINKYPYYICNDKLINENFTDIGTILAINPDFLDSHKVKE